MTGWICARCGASNAPDVKRCECKPSVTVRVTYPGGDLYWPPVQIIPITTPAVPPIDLTPFVWYGGNTGIGPVS